MGIRVKTKVKNVPLFLKIVQSVEKIGKECVLHLNPEKLEFIINGDATDGVQVWAGLNVKTLFEEYTIESNNNNEVSFEIHLDYLNRALKSALNSNEVFMKLSKNIRGLPVLCVTIEAQSSQAMHIVQEIPIIPLSAQQLLQLTEPTLPDPDVYILMPNLKLVQRVVDKMKNISDFLKIEANMAGNLKFSVQTELVTISTFYKNLEHPQIYGKDEPPKLSESICAEARVDIKKFLRFLYSHQVSPKNVILGILERRVVVIHVIIDDLCMTYYLPVTIH